MSLVCKTTEKLFYMEVIKWLYCTCKHTLVSPNLAEW